MNPTCTLIAIAGSALLGAAPAMVKPVPAVAPASTPASTPADANAAIDLPYPPAGGPRDGMFLHRATGRELSLDELCSLLADQRVVYLGESHDNLADHRAQGAIVHCLAQRAPGRVAIGMEMFEAAAQPEIDRWQAGKLDEANFDALWRSNWNIDQRYYQPVLDEIVAHRLPLRGLNLPRALIKKVTMQGLEALTKKERAALPAVGPTDPYQRQLLTAMFAGHSKGSGKVDRFIDVQNLWDEAMAAQAAAYLQSPAGQDKQLIIVAGGFHVARGLGIPRKLFQRLPLSYLICGPQLVDPDAIPDDARMDMETPAVPLPAADIYWFTGYERLPARPLLGVVVRNAEQGVLVESVKDGSVAARAGIKPDDVIVAVDGKAVQSPAELANAISAHAPGDKLRVALRRGKQRVELDVTL